MQAPTFPFGRLDDPYPMYARLRDSAPVAQVGSGMWAVSRYEDVSFVLKNHALFSSGAMGGGGFGGRTVIGVDPPEHTRMRNIVNRAFTPRMVAAMEPRIREITCGLLDAIEPNDDFDLIADLAIPVPVIIIAEILGIDAERREDFKRWSDALVFSGVTSSNPDALAAVQASQGEFREYFRDVIEERRREPREDLISALVRAEEAETLSSDQVMAFATLLLIAGNETTTNLIGNAVIALLDHPRELARVLGDLSLVPGLVEEALRYESPVQLIMRRSTLDVDLGGKTMPAGSMVMPIYASANRDERQFPDGDSFDVTRPNARDHVAFGYGVHFCLGAPLARLEGVVVLEELLRRRPALERIDAKVEWLDSFLLRGPKHLRLRSPLAATIQAPVLEESAP